MKLGGLRFWVVGRQLRRGPGYTIGVAFVSGQRVGGLVAWLAALAVGFAMMVAALPVCVVLGAGLLVSYLLVAAGFAVVLVVAPRAARAVEFRGYAGSISLVNVVSLLAAERSAPVGQGGRALLEGLLVGHDWERERLVLRARSPEAADQPVLVGFYEGLGFVRVPGQAAGVRRPLYVRAPGSYRDPRPAAVESSR